MTTARNYGIDLLRLVSVLFVVILHSLGQSGALAANNKKLYIVAWFIEIVCYGAVNMFAIISGYVGFREEKRPMKMRNLVRLWTQTVLYGVVIYLVTVILRRDMPADDGGVIMDLLPVLHGKYWYLTSYTLLFFMMPILNVGIREMSERQCRLMIPVIIGILAITSVTSGDLFRVSNGYSVWWLAVLYYVGAAMKKSDFLGKINSRWCVFGIVACSVVTWIVTMFGADMHVITFTVPREFLVSYISPTVVFGAILTVKLFAGLKIKNKWVVKAIGLLAPCSFAVYVLNTNRLVYYCYLPDWLAFSDDESGALIIVRLLLFSFVFFVCALLIECVRHIFIKILNRQLLLGKQ